MKLRWLVSISFVLIGTVTLFYGPFNHFGLETSLIRTIISLFIGGVLSAYTIIPLVGEMITEASISISKAPEDSDWINDLCAGMFNCVFCFGAILGPLIGNQGFISLGAWDTCEYAGYIVISFGILYFLLCDDAFR